MTEIVRKRPKKYEPYPDSQYEGWEAVWEAWGDDMPCPECGEKQLVSYDGATGCSACGWLQSNSVMLDTYEEGEGWEGQDRENYSDTQDRESYEVDESWIDRHSVNCIVCGKMYDERNSIADGVDGGEVCPDHKNDLGKLVADGIIEPREE